MNRVLRHLLLATFVLVAASSSNRIEAANLLVENFSGVFGTTFTLDGTSIVGASVTITADFDPSSGVLADTGTEAFAATATFMISNAGALSGTYTSEPEAIDVLTAGPTNPVLVSDGFSSTTYAIGLISPDYTSSFGGVFGGASPTFTSGPSGPTTFGIAETAFGLGGTMNISLVGGGTLSCIPDLAVDGIATSGSITLGPEIVPEPSSLALGATATTIAGLGGFLLRRRRSRIV